MSFSSLNQNGGKSLAAAAAPTFDLDDFDEDLLELSNDLDLLSLAKVDAASGERPTLESILNESDNEDDDEILKSFAQSIAAAQQSQPPVPVLVLPAGGAEPAPDGVEATSVDGRVEEGASLRRSTTSVSASSRSSSFAQQQQQQAQFKSNLIEQNGIVCKQVTLKQISSQLITAIERADAGLPTALAVSQLVAVGTSRGLVLIFDAGQILKLYLTSEHKDAISALSFNNKCDRLLVGNAIGIIFMYDSVSGKCLRQIEEAHPQGNPILNLKFTDDSKLACFSDSGGSVFMLEFKRIMGVRSADSTCLFSGSRGEVIALEPLKFEKFAESIVEKLSTSGGSSLMGPNASARKNLDSINELFARYSILAMASFTKVFVVTLRPKLTVLFTYPLTGSAKYLPIINWQFVIIQKQFQNGAGTGGSQVKRSVCPILACARESTIHFFQIEYFNQESTANSPMSSGGGDRRSNGSKQGGDDSSSYQGSLDNEDSPGKARGVPLQKTTTPGKQRLAASDPLSADNLSLQFKFVQIQKSSFDYKILNFCWLNAKTIAIMDNMERLHIVDVRTNTELQVFTNLHECVQLVYNSSFFKSLANGGYVSEALAYAGENACYQTFQSYMGKLFMLGKTAISMFSLQNWSTRIDDFVNENRLDIALDLGLAMYNGETKALVGLPLDSQQRREKIGDKLIDVLYLYVNRAMKQDCPTSGKLDVLEKHYRKCSIKCVKVCMAINRQDILFDNLYNLLSCDKLFEGYFLECLEEYVLRTNINNKKGANPLKQLDMPPLIIKNFIDYYVSKSTETNSYLGRLEKCILHFDIAKIDLHNVIQMCRKYKLIDAFIYLFNKAFNDYITPLEELIMMMKKPHYFLTYDTAKLYLKELQLNKPPAGSEKSSPRPIRSIDDYEVMSERPARAVSFALSPGGGGSQQTTSITDYGNKLLVYLHCCLCGQSYPYGTIEDDQMSDKVRRYTFDYLIGKANPLVDKLIAAEKDEISSTTSKLPRTQLDKLVYEILIKNDPNDLNLICSYPVLKILINYDLLDFLNVISMSFNEPSFEAVIGLDKKQQFIDILVDISGLNANSANFTRTLKNSANVRYLTLSDDLTGHMFTFFARQIANKSNSIQIDNNIFAQIIEYLFSADELVRSEEREQTLLGLLSTYSSEIQEHFPVERILNLALKAKFFRVCEILYELRGEYYEIVECYLNKDNAESRQQLIFDVVRNLVEILSDSGGLRDGSSSSQFNPEQKARAKTILKQRRSGSIIEPRDVQLRKLQEKLVKPFALKQMLNMNACETVHLLWVEMNMDLKQLINTIGGFDREAASGGSSKATRHSSPISSADKKMGLRPMATVQETSWGSSSNGGGIDDDFNDEDSTFSANSLMSIDHSNEEYSRTNEMSSSKILYQFMQGLFELVELIKRNRQYISYMSQFGAEYCELYIDLICLFEPDKVVELLKTQLSDYSYRIDECLRFCRERKCWDGAAYLLEKSGQIEAAFSLYLEKLRSLIKDLQNRLEVFNPSEMEVSKNNIHSQLVNIVGLCQRNSCSLNDNLKEKIWFSLFDEIMQPIRGLFIDPSIEALLNYGTTPDEERLQREMKGSSSDLLIKNRLDETRDFFKQLGSYIINSMVGYLSLTSIIDRIIGDPLYGASNFGDIRELMLKMVEMCIYEQTLLSKTELIVSKDVYSKMLAYKRFSCKSYSPYTSYCQYCSRPLDLMMSSGTPSIAVSGGGGGVAFDVKSTPAASEMVIASSSPGELDNKMAISIYHCGHSFHQSCLEMFQNQINTPCPICSLSSKSTDGVQVNPAAASAAIKLKNKKNRYKLKQQQQQLAESTAE